MVKSNKDEIEREQLYQTLKVDFIGGFLLYSEIHNTAVDVRRKAVANYSELVDMYHKTQDPKIKRAMQGLGKIIAQAMEQVDASEPLINQYERGLEFLENHNRQKDAA